MNCEAITLPACSDALARFKASNFKRNTLRGRVELAPEMPTYRAPFMERFGRLLDSDLGARVSTACIAFGGVWLVMLAIDAAARAQGF